MDIANLLPESVQRKSCCVTSPIRRISGTELLGALSWRSNSETTQFTHSQKCHTKMNFNSFLVFCSPSILPLCLFDSSNVLICGVYSFHSSSTCLCIDSLLLNVFCLVPNEGYNKLPEASRCSYISGSCRGGGGCRSNKFSLLSSSS